MALAKSQLLRARVVWPVSRPPIENGAVFISGGRIRTVGTWAAVRRQHRAAETRDLGEVVLLPGLVNAHCHLDYTDMSGEIAPTRHFTDWIKCITALKGQWSRSDYLRSWLNGAHMLVRTGTTTVGDIEAMPELLPEAWDKTPLRIISFLEMTGVRSRRDPQAILNETLCCLDGLKPHRNRIGLSPHAPYSTTPHLLQLAGRAARQRRLRLTTHVGESVLETEMFLHGRGMMFDWLAQNERNMTDCGNVSPVRHLERSRLLGASFLGIHANYLEPGDALLLGRRKASVVHCPRSHAYFKHQRFPYEELAAAGVNVCLGTDSLASVLKKQRQSVELDLFAEMRGFAASYPGVPVENILRMTTVTAARALGMAGKVGELKRNAWADIIAVPFTGPTRRVFDGILQHTGAVSASMIGGSWAVAPAD